MRHRVYVCRADIQISDIRFPGEPPAIGDAGTVRALVSAVFPETNWTSPQQGNLRMTCFSIQFVLPSLDEVTHLDLEIDHLHDSASCRTPADAVRELCERNRWAYEPLEEDPLWLITER